MDSCIYFFVDKNTYINQTTWTSEYISNISLLCVSIIFSSQASIEMTENLKFRKSRVKSTKTTKHFHSMRAGGPPRGPQRCFRGRPSECEQYFIRCRFSNKITKLKLPNGVYLYFQRDLVL